MTICEPMFNFNNALELARAGRAITRDGWNGQGMFAYFVPASEYPAQTGIAQAFFGKEAKVPYRGYLAIKTVQGDVVPWLPSQTDLQAEDWHEVTFEETPKATKKKSK